MENTVTITLDEWQRLDGLDKQFDEKLKAAVEARIDAERIFVLRDRDEYVRRNESLLKENVKMEETIAEVSGANVKLRADLEKAKRKVDSLTGIVSHFGWSEDAIKHELESAKAELEKRDENEKTLRDTVNRLREERRELLLERDELLGRGLWSRILNRRP